MHSTVPYAIDALLSDLLPLFDQNTVQLIDGPIPSRVANQTIRIVGASQWTQTSAGLGNLRRDESYILDCEARCFAGDFDPQSRRMGAFALVNTIEDAITADPGLAGVTGINIGESLYGSVRFAELERGDLTQGIDDNLGGSLAVITFGIRCNATIERTSP